QGLGSTNFGLGTSSGSMIDRQHRIWLASVGGPVNFVPSDVVGFHERLPFAISAVVADGVPLEVIKGLRIPAGVRRLEIRYTVLNRKANQNPVFRYRLDGDNSDWVETSQLETAFTNLAPGPYRVDIQ